MSLGISSSSFEESARLSAKHYRRAYRVSPGEEDDGDGDGDTTEEVMGEGSRWPPLPPAPLGMTEDDDGGGRSTLETITAAGYPTGSPLGAHELRVEIPPQSLNATKNDISCDPPDAASTYGCATRRHTEEIGWLAGKLVTLVRSLRPLLTDSDFLQDSDSRRSSVFTANKSRFSSRSRLSVMSMNEGPQRLSEFVDPVLGSFSPEDDALTKPLPEADTACDGLLPPSVGQLPRTFSLAVNGSSVYDEFLTTLDAIQRAAKSASYHACEEIGEARRSASESRRKLEALSKKHDVTVKNLMMADSRANVAYRLMALSRSSATASPPREEPASFQRLTPSNAMNEGEDDTLQDDELYSSSRPGTPNNDTDATAVLESSPVALANQLLRARRQVLQYVRLITDLPMALQEHHDRLQRRLSTEWHPAAEHLLQGCAEEMERCFDCASLMHRGEL